MTGSIVIVGGGLAAARVARAYRDAGGEDSITILSSDTDPPYNRPPLSKGFLRGEMEADAVFVEPEATYAELNVDLRLGTAVAGVRPADQSVTLADGATLPYDRLVLASGSLPRALGTPGETLEGVHTYRTLKDATAVRKAAELASAALVIGGGFIGMETTASLRRRGLAVTQVDQATELYASLQAPALSQSLERLYREHGVELILGDVVRSSAAATAS
jgi:3-phenylpropionate/trans-cinnamate dioxygenase ferredoxin reductase subunit